MEMICTKFSKIKDFKKKSVPPKGDQGDTN